MNKAMIFICILLAGAAVWATITTQEFSIGVTIKDKQISAASKRAVPNRSGFYALDTFLPESQADSLAVVAVGACYEYAQHMQQRTGVLASAFIAEQIVLEMDLYTGGRYPSTKEHQEYLINVLKLKQFN